MESTVRSLLFFLILTVILALPAAAQVCSGDVTLTTQAEVDAQRAW